jgi:membrane fusion protein, macrolide-specific efflux system
MKLKLFAILLLLVVGGAAIFVSLGGLPKSANAATSYLTGTAAVADVTDDVAATGSIASATTWSFAFGSAPTTGTASSSTTTATATQDGTWTAATVSAKIGDIVKKGQVLATATNTTLAADVVAARNDWTSAQLQRLQAQDAYDAATTTTALRQTRSSLLNAQNASNAAHAKYIDLKKAAALGRLVAPAAGIVTAVNITAGADVPTGAAITVASTDYDVTAEVVETDVSSMKLQQPATVTVSAIGANLDGTVTAIAPTATTGSSGSSSSVVSYAVTVALANPPVTLRAGMTADVTITTASATNVLAVPAAALRGSADNYTVLVMGAAGTPEARPVTVGLITSSLVEIKSGLSAGDVVVTGTNSTQRTTTGTGIGGGGGFNVTGGGGGTFRGGPGN